MDIRAQFGAAVRKLRKARGLSQEELADRAGLAVPYLSRLENGKNNPSLAILADLSLALDVPLAQLLRGIRAEKGSLPARKRSTRL